MPARALSLQRSPPPSATLTATLTVALTATLTATLFLARAVTSYISEKIFSAFLARAIPIYWGAADVEEYFNPDAFINCKKFASLAACAQRVMEVENNPALYQQYVTGRDGS